MRSAAGDVKRRANTRLTTGAAPIASATKCKSSSPFAAPPSLPIITFAAAKDALLCVQLALVETEPARDVNAKRATNERLALVAAPLDELRPRTQMRPPPPPLAGAAASDDDDEHLFLSRLEIEKPSRLVAARRA